MDLSTYKWKNRLLLVFGSSASKARYEEQLHLLKGSEADFEARDLLLGKFLRESPELCGASIPVKDAARLAEKFGVEGFTVVLVGKDGGEKFRSEKPASAGEIFARIDDMPMRRREMCERG